MAHRVGPRPKRPKPSEIQRPCESTSKYSDRLRASHGQPPHPAAKKREQMRQQTLARQRAERVQESPPDPSRIRERTLIARFPGLTSWWDCPVPLTGAYSRDIYADGHEDGWLLVTTNEDWSALACATYTASAPISKSGIGR